MVNNHTRFG